MSKETIPPPIQASVSVVLPYYPGCMYVSYQSDDNNPVSFQSNCIKTNKTNFQDISLTFLESQPDSLGFYIHFFDVMELKVLI